MRQELNIDRLRDNALTSIRLGVEDFQMAQEKDGDKSRALSSIRNLFSGLLLLFKYKIASLVNSVSEAEQLIFNPTSVEPELDSEGNVFWRSSDKLKSTTIDFSGIKKRFESFGIGVDWTSLEKIQRCRNNLEHLYPADTLGEVSEMIYNLFPILKDFILNELNSKPIELLGSVWVEIFKHHEMFVKNKTECNKLWVNVRMPERLLSLTPNLRCFCCLSNLMFPDKSQMEDELSLDGDEGDFLCHCMVCGEQQLIFDTITEYIDTVNYNSLKDGGNPEFENCLSCNNDMFNIVECVCFWCGEGLEFDECYVCSQPLSQDEQSNNGLCSYHNYACGRAMRD